jgi:hypothetical protein
MKSWCFVKVGWWRGGEEWCKGEETGERVLR